MAPMMTYQYDEAPTSTNSPPPPVPPPLARDVAQNSLFADASLSRLLRMDGVGLFLHSTSKFIYSTPLLIHAREMRVRPSSAQLQLKWCICPLAARSSSSCTCA
jgi:hypothetical protein